MSKKVIKISEQDIGNIVNEVIDRVIDNGSYCIDLTQFDDETLEQEYKDFRLIPQPHFFDDVYQLKEAVGDILPPDGVIKKITQKYNINPDFIRKVEANNKIAIYLVIAEIGENVQIIRNEMEKMGYFLGHIGKRSVINKKKFVELQFEPYWQMQDDETDNIKSEYSTLYHWTPEYNVKEILANGLEPSNKSKYYYYPPRIYLLKDGDNADYTNAFGRALCSRNNDPRNNGSYVLLGIDIVNLNDNIRFFLDPNSTIGIYTEQQIPPENINVIRKEQFK